MSELPCESEPVGLFAGQHVLAELEGVSPELLDDEQFLRHALGEALTQADATVLEVVSKQFEPQGVTVLALLSESHASIHTYPEVGAVFVDVFTCGTRAKPALAVFPRPFWAFRRDRRTVRLWGQIRPGGRHTVTIERRSGSMLSRAHDLLGELDNRYPGETLVDEYRDRLAAESAGQDW